MITILDCNLHNFMSNFNRVTEAQKKHGDGKDM